MKDIPWSRETAIADVRRDLWRYLSDAATPHEQLMEAGALLQLPLADVAVLADLRFLLSSQVESFLEGLPSLMRRLSTTTVDEEEWTRGAIRGPINWSRTIGARSSQGWAPNLYVTTPVRGAYQTPENEMLVHVLDSVARVARRIGPHFGGTGSGQDTVGFRRRKIELVTSRWSSNRALSAVDRRAPTPRSASRVRSGRRARAYAAVIAAYNRLLGLVERLDRQAVREAVEAYALAPADAVLFELKVVFRTLDILSADLGWDLSDGFRLMGGHLELRGSRGKERIEVWYQDTPSDLSAGSNRTAVLVAHGIRPSTLVPDLVLRVTGQGARADAKWVLIECKIRRGGVVDGARAALDDLLAYRRAFEPVLNAIPLPYGIGVCHGAELAPEDAEIQLCTPDTLSAALRRVAA